MKIYVYHLVIYPSKLEKYAKGNQEIYNLWNPEFDSGSINTIYEILDRLDSYKMDSGKIIYTYAVTDNKKYAKIFECTHDMNLFKKSTWDMSKKEYENYQNQHNEPILTNVEIGKSHSIVMTNIEHDVINDNAIDSVIYALTFFTNHEYAALHKKYIIALDKLLYCTLFKIYNVDDEEDSSFYEYNFQYGVTAEQTTSKPLSISIKNLAVYIGILLPFLNKEGLVHND